jgi:hypothetical protein
MPSCAPGRAVRTPLAIVGVLALAALLAGCGDISWEPPATPVAGTGDTQTEVRTQGDFTRVSVAAPVRIVVGSGGETAVTVEAQANVLPLIATDVVDGQLVVSMKAPGFTTVEGSLPKVTINTPALTSLAMAGSSVGTLESSAPELRLDITGQSSLTAIGTVPTLALSMAQSSKADFTDLQVTDATIKLADGSAATMAVSGSLTGSADGGSTLTLTTKPTSQAVETSGGGSVLGP